MLLLTVKHMSGRLSVTETTANVPVTQRNNYTKYLFRNVWNEAREFTPLVCLYMIMTGLCVCVCVCQMPHPSMQPRPSSTVCDLKWRSTASSSAPSAIPSSMPPSPPQWRSLSLSRTLWLPVSTTPPPTWVPLHVLKVTYCHSSSTDISSQLTHGVSPSVLANEIVQAVNRKRREVVLAHPIPRVALYLRSLFPASLFAVLSAGVKDSVLAEM